MTCLSCGARWSRKTGRDDIQMKMGLTIDQPQVTPPCAGCASTTRLQQMANKTETFFGCSRFPLCKGVVHTSHTLESRVSPSTHSCSAAQPMAEQVMVLDSDSVGSEESFTMLNVPAELAVTPQEQQFLLEQLLHLSSSGITGQEARRAIVRMFPDKTAEDQGEQGSSDSARHDAEDLNNTGVMQSVRVWTDKTDLNADTWEAAIRHFSKVGVSICFLMEIDNGCLQPTVFDESIFGENIGSLVKNAVGVWELAVKTNVSQNRCRVFRKSPWWNLLCDDDVWLREHATTNRAQNSFVDEQLEQIQSAHDELRCYFAGHKTMQIRPAMTYDLSDKSRICLLDLRDAPNCEFEAIRQHMRNMKPYMLTVQYNDDNSNDDSIRALCEQQANQGGYFLLNLRSCPKEQDPTWDTSLGFLHQFAETGEDLHLHFDSAKRVAEAAVESAIARFQRTGWARRWDGTFFTTWSTPLIGNFVKSGPQES